MFFFQWMCEKQFDIVKSKVILSFFIENFISMASVATKISTKYQALFHLKQAWYLTRLLDLTSPSFGPEAMEYRETINELETSMKKHFAMKKGDDEPVAPQTPARNSMQFDFVDHPTRSNVLRPRSEVLFKSNSIEKATSSKSQPRVARFKKTISFIDPQN